MKIRQPRRTQTQWAEIIEQQSQSGQTIRTFCEENDIGLASFGKWKQKLKRAEPAEDIQVVQPMFQPVGISESDNVTQSSTDSTTVTLSLGSNVTLTIRTNEPTL